MIVEIIKKEISPGVEIPKPNPNGRFLVKGWGRRREEDALVYTIPNHKNPTKPYEKGITASEFETAYKQLRASGELTRHWFDVHLPSCAKEGSCNFTTVGGIFDVLGEAKYVGNGLYRHQSSDSWR